MLTEAYVIIRGATRHPGGSCFKVLMPRLDEKKAQIPKAVIPNVVEPR